MEITGQMLIEFANNNGLEILSHRDPDKWAKKLNENGGFCPCGKECPCDACTCLFFKKRKFAVPELGGAIEALEEVKRTLMEIDETEPDRVEEILENGKQLISEDIEKHSCGKCKDYMGGLHRKLSYLQEECKQDGMSCRTEIDLTIHRIDMMQEVFYGTDKTIEEQSTSEDNEKQETQWDGDEVVDTRSEFHKCMSDEIERLKETNPDMPHRTRVCVASKMCKKTPMSREAAINECKGGK